jgi:MFS family permease
VRHESETRRGGIRRLPWNRPFITVLVVNGVYLWIIGAVFQTLVPLFGTSTYIGLSITGVGFALGVATATELVALFPAGKASDRRGRRAVLIPALAGLALTTALLGQVSTPLAFIVVLGALGVASAYSGVPPVSMLSDVAPEELKGTAVGVFRFVGDLGFVLGPLVAGWSAGSFGFGTAFIVTAIPALLSVALVVSIKETMNSRGP